MSETVTTLGYEWRWLRADTNIIEAQEQYVVIECGYRHLVLHRAEQWQSDMRGGVRYIPVEKYGIPEGEL